MRYNVTLERISRYRVVLALEAEDRDKARERAFELANNQLVSWEFAGHSSLVALETEECEYTFTDPHPEYPVTDWQYEVANAYTCLGYHEWVVDKLEAGLCKK